MGKEYDMSKVESSHLTQGFESSQLTQGFGDTKTDIGVNTNLIIITGAAVLLLCLVTGICLLAFVNSKGDGTEDVTGSGGGTLGDYIRIPSGSKKPSSVPLPSPPASTPENTTTTATTPPVIIQPPRKFQFKKEAVICVYGTGFGNDLKFADAGLCDMTLLDSLYKDGRNPFEGPYEADVQHFLSNARDKKNDQFGLSIDFLNYKKLQKVIALGKMYKIMDDFWYDRIFHYAMIDISPYTQSKSEVTEAVSAMKKLDQVLQVLSIGRNQTTFITLGFSPIGPDWKSFASTILRTFTPDIFVLRGHYSLTNDDKPGCKMAPPNIYKTTPDFPVSMQAAHEGLLQLASEGHHCAWAVSMSAAGRWNHPLMGASLNWRDYEPFSPCAPLPFKKKQLGTILDVCYVDYYKRSTSTAYKTMFAFSTQMGLSMMYDSAETMREKLCNFKANMTEVKYGVAVFDAEYGDPEGWCKFGKFGRIAMAGRLVAYFGDKFKTGSDLTDCLLLPSS